MGPIRTINNSEFRNSGMLQLFDDIFASGNRLPRNPFRKEGWVLVLLPYGLNQPPNVVESIVSACQAAGDEEAILTDVETSPPHQCSVSFPFTAEAYARVATSSEVGHFDCAMFGRSKRWGLYFSSDDITCASGDAEFLAGFMKQLGGQQNVTKILEEYVRSEWQVTDEFRNAVMGLASATDSKNRF